MRSTWCDKREIIYVRVTDFYYNACFQINLEFMLIKKWKVVVAVRAESFN